MTIRDENEEFTNVIVNIKGMNDCLKAHRHTKAIKCHNICVK